jgi:alpha-beta hydrolase superfamily lysophospholipase
VTRLFFDDELLDAQLLRVVGAACCGGSDVGECLAAAQRVRGIDLDSWHDSWRALADDTRGLAQRSETAGQCETARLAYLRASSYYRTAGVMLMAAPPDGRLVACNRDQAEAFRAAAGLMALPPEIVEIPFEGSSLPGYFFGAAAGDEPRATVILIGGYDGTAEELYFFNGVAALARGYNVLAIDGPGQGAALLQRGLTMRADWETVVSALVDYACSRSDVAPERIALIGLSLGAHLAPRAASGEHRVAACVADCGGFDLFEDALRRMPAPLARGLRDRSVWARVLIRGVLAVLARKPTAGWALRRGMLVHGARSPLAYIESLRAFSLAGRAEQISCPMWVCNAEEDDVGASAPQLVEALACETTFVQFTTAEGAGDHCEQGARMLYHARSFGWLDQQLTPRADQAS